MFCLAKKIKNKKDCEGINRHFKPHSLWCFVRAAQEVTPSLSPPALLRKIPESPEETGHFHKYE